eukprot:Platyproteum_vivax@DN3994_c0_g1_i1.p1
MLPQEFLDDVDNRLHDFPIIAQVSGFVGVRPTVIGAGLLAGLLGFFALGVGANLVTNLVGFLYPAFMSFKAIESSDTDDDKMWLTYWVVYAAFSVVEVFTDYVLFWIPMYYLIKIVFLVWLFHPQTQGAISVYSYVIAPILKQTSNQFDSLGNYMEDELLVENEHEAGEAQKPEVLKRVASAYTEATEPTPSGLKQKSMTVPPSSLIEPK